MTINFQDPRLQRSRQKMAALGPDSGAIFDNWSASSDFAERDAIKNLRLLRTGHRLKTQRENFKLRQQERMDQLNLAKDRFDFDRRQGIIGSAIAGASLIPQAYLGYKGYQQSGKTVEDLLKLRDRIQGSTDRMKI